LLACQVTAVAGSRATKPSEAASPDSDRNQRVAAGGSGEGIVS